MPKKNDAPQYNFVEAAKEVATIKGISFETVIAALKEAATRAYIKTLEGGENADDAEVVCEIDEETGKITIGQYKNVMEDDDITDDYLEISVEDANDYEKENNPKSKVKYKAGDKILIKADQELTTKSMALAIKNLFRQKANEYERIALYDIYKDHIGELITGTVEKADERSVSVNIGRTVVELGRKEMIGNEFFRIGDPIKVYIQEVRSTTVDPSKPVKGPQIQITRASEGFLKRLFEEEIHEIYDGTVIIKGIAREAGVRSKVAVYSANDDVDPTGACIGQGGSRIQKVVAQLGNGGDKEKIDIINWTKNPGAYIVEALRPATVIGVALNGENEEGKPSATAIVKDGSLSLAIGRRGANVRLACRLTGYSIDVKEEAVAAELGIEYVAADILKEQAAAEKKVAEREEYLRKTQEEAAARAAAYVAPTPAAEATKEVELPPEAINPAAAALEADRAARAAEAKAAEEAKLAEEAKAVAVEEEKPAPAAKPTAVVTTTTISDLEKELEAAKEKKAQPKPKKPRKITEEEVKREAAPTATPIAPAAEVMPIYTAEELEEIEKEEAMADIDNLDDDVDYEDYDEYYDSDK
ncbi:MAG: transcription termination factor NusA [Bacilli bacterium]|nr:transcription termination factor NusA [Bacilli bacterium]